MEHALAQAEHIWRKVPTPGLDDLEALRHGVVLQVIFSGAPQVLRIMDHEGAIDSPRVRFVVERLSTCCAAGFERLLSRLVAAGYIRPVPYATLHNRVSGGGGALFANPVGAPRCTRAPRRGGHPHHAEADAHRWHRGDTARIRRHRWPHECRLMLAPLARASRSPTVWTR